MLSYVATIYSFYVPGLAIEADTDGIFECTVTLKVIQLIVGSIFSYSRFTVVAVS